MSVIARSLYMCYFNYCRNVNMAYFKFRIDMLDYNYDCCEDACGEREQVCRDTGLSYKIITMSKLHCDSSWLTYEAFAWLNVSQVTYSFWHYYAILRLVILNSRVETWDRKLAKNGMENMPHHDTSSLLGFIFNIFWDWQWFDIG